MEARLTLCLGTRVVYKGRDIHGPHHVLMAQQLVAVQGDLGGWGVTASVLPASSSPGDRGPLWDGPFLETVPGHRRPPAPYPGLPRAPPLLYIPAGWLHQSQRTRRLLGPTC